MSVKYHLIPAHVYSVESISLYRALGKQTSFVFLSTKWLLQHHLSLERCCICLCEKMTKYHFAVSFGFTFFTFVFPSLQQKLAKLLINASWSFLSCGYNFCSTILQASFLESSNCRWNIIRKKYPECCDASVQHLSLMLGFPEVYHVMFSDCCVILWSFLQEKKVVLFKVP